MGKNEGHKAAQALKAAAPDDPTPGNADGAPSRPAGLRFLLTTCRCQHAWCFEQYEHGLSTSYARIEAWARQASRYRTSPIAQASIAWVLLADSTRACLSSGGPLRHSLEGYSASLCGLSPLRPSACQPHSLGAIVDCISYRAGSVCMCTANRMRGGGAIHTWAVLRRGFDNENLASGTRPPTIQTAVCGMLSCSFSLVHTKGSKGQ